jgi:excisionase family DNA binding protein
VEKLAYTIPEAAEILGCSADTLYDAVQAGHLAKLPHVAAGCSSRRSPSSVSPLACHRRRRSSSR